VPGDLSSSARYYATGRRVNEINDGNYRDAIPSSDCILAIISQMNHSVSMTPSVRSRLREISEEGRGRVPREERVLSSRVSRSIRARCHLRSASSVSDAFR